MQRPLFLPTIRQTCWLLTVAVLAIGWALYMRYMVIQVPEKSLACQAGLDTWTCLARKVAMNFFQNNVFGVVALGAALLNLIRPSIMLATVVLATAGLGLVLHNVSLSAFAIALLLLSLARTAPLPE